MKMVVACCIWHEKVVQGCRLLCRLLPRHPGLIGHHAPVTCCFSYSCEQLWSCFWACLAVGGMSEEMGRWGDACPSWEHKAYQAWSSLCICLSSMKPLSSAVWISWWQREGPCLPLVTLPLGPAGSGARTSPVPPARGCVGCKFRAWLCCELEIIR